MKILWLTWDPPIAPFGGGRERALYTLNYLTARHQVYMLTFANPEEIEQVRAIPGVVRAHPITYGHVATMRAIMQALIEKWKPDFIHVQNFALYGIVPPGIKHVLDPFDMPHDSLLAEKGEHYFEAVRRSTATILVSEGERDKLPEGLRSKIVVIPNGVDVDYWARGYGVPQQPATLLFPASLCWEPNIVGAQEFVRQVWAGVRAEVPEAQIVFAGRLPTPDVQALASKKHGIRVVADPQDMRRYFAQATAVVVPILKATGTRLKILQALASGRAVLSTPVGAEGLDLLPGRDLLIEPLGEAFVRAAVTLLKDGEKRAGLVQHGRQAVERYRWEALVPMLEQVYPAA
ncbi:MAG: glycosyltransferase family 4 protein [Chloroflexota bacterium]